jgi:hypothetical protein
MRTSLSRIGAGAFATLLAAAPHAGAATNVVTCLPSGNSSVVAVSPGMVNNLSPDAAFGLKLTTAVNNCTANAAQLDAWVPSKNGTPAAIAAAVAKAVVSVKAKGFGTCDFASPTPSAYPSNGQLSIKWYDGSGAVSKMKSTKASVRISADLGSLSVQAEGIVTKGTGMGANILARTGFDLANPINGPVLVCLTGPYNGPPITQIALKNLPTDILTIDFP